MDDFGQQLSKKTTGQIQTFQHFSLHKIHLNYELAIKAIIFLNRLKSKRFMLGSIMYNFENIFH